MSPSWPEVELGDVLQKIVGGGTPARGNPDFWEGDIPWATVKDMKEGVFKLSETQESITALGLSKSASNLIPAGTVVTSTRMGLGRCFIPTRSVAINQDLKALFPNASIDSQYLLWLLVSMAGEIQNMGTGTTVSGIRLEQLRALRFPLPPLPTQRKIASILSAYDDLIENNTRRVQVLEQMARALYREWFVEYRFPGHEQAEWVEDEARRRPKGWEWQELRYLFDVKYGKTLPKTKISSEGEYPVYGAGDIIGFYNQKLENQKVVLVTSRGAGSGHVWRTRSPAFITNNSLIVKPNLLTRHLSYGFIQHLLENSNLLRGCQQGV